MDAGEGDDAILFTRIAVPPATAPITTPAATSPPQRRIAGFCFRGRNGRTCSPLIRDSMPVGSVLVYRRVESGKDPYIDRMTVVAADPSGCKIADAIVDEAVDILDRSLSEILARPAARSA